LKAIKADPSKFVDHAGALHLNSQLRGRFIAMDVIHLFVSSAVSLVVALVFVLVPLLASPVGRSPWEGKIPSLLYFAALGAGFIIIELTMIQMFINLVGNPLYATTVVIFTLLASAALGSFASKRLVGSAGERYWLPFVAIIVVGLTFIGCHDWIVFQVLPAPLPVRVVASALLIFPLGFFLGMPFPLGILVVADKPRGAVAWAWAMNGLMTVVGGILSVVGFIYLGFRATFLIALAIYVIPYIAIRIMRRNVGSATALS